MTEIITPKNKILTPKLTEIEFKEAFRKKLTELQEWGVGQGYFITAYLDLTPNGAFPSIGYRLLKQEEKAKVK